MTEIKVGQIWRETTTGGLTKRLVQIVDAGPVFISVRRVVRAAIPSSPPPRYWRPAAHSRVTNASRGQFSGYRSSYMLVEDVE